MLQFKPTKPITNLTSPPQHLQKTSEMKKKKNPHQKTPQNPSLHLLQIKTTKPNTIDRTSPPQHLQNPSQKPTSENTTESQTEAATNQDSNSSSQQTGPHPVTISTNTHLRKNLPDRHPHPISAPLYSSLSKTQIGKRRRTH